MARTIYISNEKGRDTTVDYIGQVQQKKIRFVSADGEDISNRKYIKASSGQSLNALLEKYGSIEELTEAMKTEDPELDMEVTGKFLNQTSRVYINEFNKVVFRISKTEKIYTNKGELKEEREPRQLESNVTGEVPLKWSGKLFPKAKVYNKFVFIRKYQIVHDSGLKYDFLYEIAKKLQEENALMLIGSGKGTGPVVFQEGGKPFRAFLEGRVKGDQYLLIMHISNLELKPLPKEEEA